MSASVADDRSEICKPNCKPTARQGTISAVTRWVRIPPSPPFVRTRMRSLPVVTLLTLVMLGFSCQAADARARSTGPMNRAQSLLNAFQITCTLELPNFEDITAKAAAMRMTLTVDKTQPAANDTVQHDQVWVGALTDGPYLLLVSTLSGSKGVSTSCAIAGSVDDQDAFRAEAIKKMTLPESINPEMGSDGSRSFVWDHIYGSGTTLIIRDFPAKRELGVMVKLLSMKKADQ